MIPLTAFLIVAAGRLCGRRLANGLKAVNDFSPFIFSSDPHPDAVPVHGAAGLHWPLNAIMLLNIQTLGFDFIQGPMGAWNFACSAPPPACCSCRCATVTWTMRQTATGAPGGRVVGWHLRAEPVRHPPAGLGGSIHASWWAASWVAWCRASGGGLHHERLRVHLAVDDSGVQQHPAVCYLDRGGVLQLDVAGGLLRLPHGRRARRGCQGARHRGRRPGRRGGPKASAEAHKAELRADDAEARADQAEQRAATTTVAVERAAQVATAVALARTALAPNAVTQIARRWPAMWCRWTRSPIPSSRRAPWVWAWVSILPGTRSPHRATARSSSPRTPDTPSASCPTTASNCSSTWASTPSTWAAPASTSTSPAATASPPATSLSASTAR